MVRRKFRAGLRPIRDGGVLVPQFVYHCAVAARGCGLADQENVSDLLPAGATDTGNGHPMRKQILYSQRCLELNRDLL